LTGRRRGRYIRRAALIGAAMLVMGITARDSVFGVRLIVVGSALLLGTFAVWRRGRSGSAGTVRRWSRRSSRHDGVASRWAVLRTSSRFAVRRKMLVLRPDLRRLPWWRRVFVPTREIAAPIARIGWLRVWSPIEDTTLRFGGPRVGKSGEMACRILDAPGAVIATSTRTDLVKLTKYLRGERGPVWVFNPAGIGGLESTIVFDPLSGCEQPKVAVERAADLVAGAKAPAGVANSDLEFWSGQARRALAVLMHAAALGGVSMREVKTWVANPDTGSADVQRYLRRSPEPAFESDAEQFLTLNTKTRSSICETISPALDWLGDPTAAQSAGQTVGRKVQIDESGVTVTGPQPFDVAQLLDSRGTVYMLGAQDAQTAPLVTALTGHIARSARQIAGRMPDGRLTPPLTVCLDEAALICPIPLDEWTADMGGRNVTIHIAAQSRPQLRKRWDHDGAAAIVNNAATVLIFGGTRDSDDLAAYSALCGERDERVLTYDQHGKVTSETVRRVPVMSGAQIAQLRAGQVVLITRGMPPAIATVKMAWKRHDVKVVQRGMRRFERAVERYAVRAERAATWNRRRQWVAARVEQLVQAIVALIQRADEAWARRESERRPDR
jgi:type IV secretion system protein VirD4